MIKVQYQKLHILLYEEEQLQLQALHREAQEISQQLKDSEMRMTQQKHQVKETYRELAEACRKPDLELLQVSRESPCSGKEVLSWARS